MTEALFHVDSYLREFDDRVSAVNRGAVALGRTAFYPGGGGQPHDEGALSAEGAAWRVASVQWQGDDVWHELEGGPPPAVGTAVHGAVDWDRRHALMRTHTALHILCGVIFRDYGALVTGGNMTPLAARMDFELEQMSSSFAAEVEAGANVEIAAARPIRVGFLARDEVGRTPGLIRTKINLLPSAVAKVRIVNIEGLDLQADGGTHVANTSEVGRIRIVGHESKGRINKRLRIVVADA